MHPTYLASHVKDALAADPVAASLDLKVNVREGTVHVFGEVASEEVRCAVDIRGERLATVGAKGFDSPIVLRMQNLTT